MNIDLLPKVRMTFHRVVERMNTPHPTTATPSFSMTVIKTTEEIEPKFGAFLCKAYENTNGELGIDKEDYVAVLLENIDQSPRLKALFKDLENGFDHKGACQLMTNLLSGMVKQLINKDNTDWEYWI